MSTRASPRGTALRKVCRVRRLFSAARGGADRTVVPMLPQFGAYPAGLRARPGRPAPGRMGALEESLRRRLRRAFCRGRLRQPEELQRVILSHRDRVILDPDLLRFLGYTDMALGSRSPRLRLDGKFSPTVFLVEPGQGLAPLGTSLSTWFRDYVYIPLGGNRVSGFRWVFNIMIVSS